MRFLYKIYSNYDGFVPAKIPERLNEGHYLSLGWTRYLDEVDRTDECWIYFHGRHAFKPGVYIKGYVTNIDRDAGQVVLRVREFATAAPLTDDITTARIRDVVGAKFRQVFVWPDEWDTIPECRLEACRKRLCDNCPTWQSIPTIAPGHVYPLSGVPARAIIPAYWVIPNRCYLYQEAKRPALSTVRLTHMFGEFKLGEDGYVYPLARGIFDTLMQHNLLEYEAVVPIPLSPDKEAAGELHRTRALALEIARLLGQVPIWQYLSLNEPVSKRRMLSAGHSRTQFRETYHRALVIDPAVRDVNKILLIDDVITEGLTVGCAVRALREVNSQIDIVIAAAGQMIVKRAVVDEHDFLATEPGSGND